MRHTIKIDTANHEFLLGMKSGKDDFNAVVTRVLDVFRVLKGIEPILRGSYEYHRWQQSREAQQAAADRSGDRQALPFVLEQ